MRLCTIAVLFAASPVVARQQPDPEDPRVVCSSRLRTLVQACIVYGQEHGGFPPDLAAAAPFVGDEDGATPITRELLERHFVSPADAGARVPPDAGADWINAGSSYAYIGRAGVSWQDVPEWGSTVVAYLRLDRPHAAEVSPLNPTGEGFMLGYADNHVDFVISRADAEQRIEESKQTWEALATGSPFPERIQALWNLGRIAKAVRAYAEEHDGMMPPTLGDAFPFVPPDPKRAATPRQRAALFLSARAQKNTFIPEDPTPEWVNRNTSYMYPGATAPPGEIRLARVADAARTVLVHSRPADVIEGAYGYPPGTRFHAIATVAGEPGIQPEEYATWIIGESRKVFDAAAGRGALPDFQHAVQDVTILQRAVIAYVEANGGVLPPDLGATLEYIPVDALAADTAAERARVFLSPRAERASPPPQEPTADWVRHHGSYVYLPAAGTRWEAVRYGRPTILIHSPPDETYPIRNPAGRESVVVAGYEENDVTNIRSDAFDRFLAEAKADLEEARRAQPPR